MLCQRRLAVSEAGGKQGCTRFRVKVNIKHYCSQTSFSCSHSVSVSRPGLLQRGHSLFRAGGSQPSNPGHRRADNVPALLPRPANAGHPQRQVPTHPPAGAAVHAASQPGAAGALHPAALHGEGSGADLREAGSVRKEVLPGAGLLDGASHDQPGPPQDGEKQRASAALQ